ncbi:calpastatin isoform X2 [Pelobates fuscus]|uniref:calpastatin isoform X2 n=1 Tax=Pelobates fuscus TaxID=191477 RepID=UPI002FE45E99
MAFASWWYATQGDKKTAGASKPTDKKTPESTEKKPSASSVSQSARAQPSGASGARGATGASKAQPSQDRTMKPADQKAIPSQEKSTRPSDHAQSSQEKATKPADPKAPPSEEKTAKPSDPKARQTSKPEPAKPVQSTKPKSTTTTTSATSKQSITKPASKQDSKPDPGKEKTGSKVSSGTVGKVAATAAAGTVVAAAAVGAASAAAVKQKDEVKEEKKAVSADKVSAAAAAPAKSDIDDALDELVNTLSGPDPFPESPKFTGPEIKEDPAISEYLEELGKRESTIPPEYRKLLDGKGEKPAEQVEESFGDDELLEALSSDFVSCPAPPEGKKPKLEECIAIKPTSAAAVSSKPGTETVPQDALDELLGTLEGPPVNVPESPQFTGPIITETAITSSYLEELGKKESTIPPKYRHLLDGKDHGKEVPPPVPSDEPKSLTDAELADEFSKDFDFSSSPTVPPSSSTKLTDGKPQTPDQVVALSASSSQSAAKPSGDVDSSALDELMRTLDGPEFAVPESPIFTGPEVTETSTATYIEGLGERDSTIPPEYRHLLDGKVDGNVVPPPPEEKPMDDDELAAALDFASPQPAAVLQTPPIKPKPQDAATLDIASPQPAAVLQTPPIKPKDSSAKKPESDVVVSSSSSSAVQSAPVSSKPPVLKGSAPKADPLDALAGTLEVRQVEDHKDKKPAVDSVKEKTDQKKQDKLGEDEETIPPDYRLKEVKDKDGKPILPKPEDKPKELSEDELLDAFSAGFETSQTAPLQCSGKEPKSMSGSGEVVSCAKAPAVKAGAPRPAEPGTPISDDALDLLSGTLGSREPDPNENKPIVDKVKEKATSEHIERLGDRDSTIPPEYRHLLDGKDEKGQPIKPPSKEEMKSEKSIDDDSAIDALSSGFASCDTKSTEKVQQTSKDKTEKTSSCSTVSQSSGKTLDPVKEKTDKSSSSTTVSQSSGKASDPPKSANETSPAKPSTQKTSRS